ncbi:MAG: acetyl-CoA carboxylase carboxyltransferase subunit alpha [Firmicutes bacterium]|nr:acetyl-CoA carboxylase carboxyltransferase subunit alpha [Bacillota bacterium]
MGNGYTLEFEKKLVELEKKIEELKRYAEEKGLDMAEEIAPLERRAQELAREIYSHLEPWQRVLIARHPKRPTFLELVSFIFQDFLELHGDRNFRDDPAMVGGLAWLDGRAVTVIGEQKGRDTKENLARNFGLPHPEGYRKALRLMQQAAKFGRPIISFIDVVGAYPGIEAEERGQGEAIARNLREMSILPVPIIAVITGEGGSGGALATGVGDRLYMLEHAYYSVISPEGCASILWKDATKAPEAAKALKFNAEDLLAFGVIDGIIPEPLGGAHRDPAQTAANIKRTIVAALEELVKIPGSMLVEERYRRLRRLGVYGTS